MTLMQEARNYCGTSWSFFRTFLEMLLHRWYTQGFFFTIFLLFFLGFPQVEYRWMKDGVFLSDFSSEHFYKIQSVSRTDAGDYRCYAKNSVGTIISEKIRLTVACKLHIFQKTILYSLKIGRLLNTNYNEKLELFQRFAEK